MDLGLLSHLKMSLLWGIKTPLKCFQLNDRRIIIVSNLRFQKIIKTLRSWAVPLLLSFQTILSSLQFLDHFKVVYYPMISRATSEVRFELDINFSFFMLLLLFFWFEWMFINKRFKMTIIPLSSIILFPFFKLEFIVTVATILAIITGLFIWKNIEKYLTCIFFLLSIFDLLSLSHWLIFLPMGLRSPTKKIANLEMALFYVTGLAAPILAVPMLFSWIIYLLNLKKVDKTSPNFINPKNKDTLLSNRKIFFIIMLFLGMISSLYPYLSNVNTLQRNVGADFMSYVEKLEMISNDPYLIINSNRPLIYILFYIIQLLFKISSILTVKLFVVVVYPMLLIGAYCLYSEIFQNKNDAIWAMFFTLCGIKVTAGIYSHFIANLFAIAIIYFSLTLLIQTLKLKKTKYLYISSFLGFLIVFIHPWTFDQFVIAVLLMIGYILYSTIKNKNYDQIKVFFIYIFILGLSEVSKVYIFKGTGGMDASSTAISSFSSLSNFWIDSLYCFRRLYGGTMSNFLLILFSIIGVLLLEKKIGERFLIYFLAPTSFLYVVVNGIIKSRLFFNIPIGILSAYGFICLKNRLNNENLVKWFTTFVVLASLVYLFRSLANMV